MISKKKIEFIKNLLNFEGTSFKWYGRDSQGLDCLGLFITSRNDAGYHFFDTKDYSKLPRNKHFIDTISVLTNKIIEDKNDIDVGDIILMKYNKSIYPHHLIIYLGQNKYIHCHQDRGVCIEELSSKDIDSIYKIFRL